MPDLDVLVVAAHVDHSLHDNVPAQDLLGPEHQEFTWFFSFTWVSDTKWDKGDRVYFVPALQDEKVDVMTGIRLGGGDKSSGYVYTGTGYASHWISDDDPSFILLLNEHVLEELGFTVSRAVLMRVFKYDIRWTPEAIRNRVPERLANAQGRRNVYYAGGSRSHWNVDSIMEHNAHLVDLIEFQSADKDGAAHRHFKQNWETHTWASW